MKSFDEEIIVSEEEDSEHMTPYELSQQNSHIIYENADQTIPLNKTDDDSKQQENSKFLTLPSSIGNSCKASKINEIQKENFNSLREPISQMNNPQLQDNDTSKESDDEDKTVIFDKVDDNN